MNMEKYFSLKKRIAVYIPSTVNIDTETDTTAYFEYFTALFSECFGGCTAYNASGFWIAETGKTVNENVKIIYSFCDETALENNIEKIIADVKKMKNELNQEAISLEIDSKLYFID